MRRHNREENVHLGQSGHVESRLVVSITGVVMIRHGHVALKTVQAVSGKLRVSRAVPGWAAQLVVCLLSVCPVSLHSQLFRGKMRPELSWAGLGEELWQVELWVETGTRVTLALLTQTSRLSKHFVCCAMCICTAAAHHNQI